MLTFTRLNIQGFCSIDSFSLQLNQDCTVLIKAPNGFGKSTLLNALVWALYGKNIKGVSEVNTWKEYQPKDYKGTMVEVFFQKNQDSYKVIRCQKFKDYLEMVLKEMIDLSSLKMPRLLISRVRMNYRMPSIKN